MIVTVLPTAHPENFASLDFGLSLLAGFLLVGIGAWMRVYEFQKAVTAGDRRFEAAMTGTKEYLEAVKATTVGPQPQP
jgi:hypothetical protein